MFGGTVTGEVKKTAFPSDAIYIAEAVNSA
jgi:hypothetical protein